MQYAICIIVGLLFAAALSAASTAAGSSAPVEGERVTRRFGEHATCGVKGVTADACVAGKAGDGTGEAFYFRYPAAHILIRFDLSSIAKGRKVHAARLRLYQKEGYQPDKKEGHRGLLKDVLMAADPDGSGLWDPKEATGLHKRKGQPWSAKGDVATALGAKAGSMYFKNWEARSQAFLDADITPAVQAWVDKPESNLGLVIPGDAFQNRRIWSSRAADASRRPYLEVTYADANDENIPQASALSATCHSGQTFLTWKEPATGRDETSFRVYRGEKPITAESLDQAELLTDLYAGSSYFSDALGADPSRIRQIDLTPAGIGLQADSGLCVYPIPRKQSSYYAVTTVVEGNENRTVTAGVNATRTAVAEQPDLPAAFEFNRHKDLPYVGYIMFLGRVNPLDAKDEFGFDNRLSAPFLFSVIPPRKTDPKAVKSIPLVLYLHPFGRGYFGSWDGYQNALAFTGPDGRTLTGGYCVGFADYHRLIVKDKDGKPRDIGPYLETSAEGYSNYMGWNSHYTPMALSLLGLPKTRQSVEPFDTGRSVPYTEKAIAFIAKWMALRGPFAAQIDPARTYAVGTSMGAIGSTCLAVHRPREVAAVAAFKGRYVLEAGASSVRKANLFGGNVENIPTPDGVKVLDYYNLPEMLRRNPGLPYPPMRIWQGRKDTTVGWSHVPALAAAAAEIRTGLTVYFDQSSHNADDPAAKFPELHNHETFPKTQNQPGFNIFHYRLDRAYLAFTAGELDDKIGSGPAGEGDERGGINRFVYWDWTAVVDEAGRFEASLYLLPQAPAGKTTASVTPRRLQKFAPTAGEKVAWRLVDGSAVLQRGEVAADPHGLVTVPNLVIRRKPARLVLEKHSAGGQAHDAPIPQ